MPQVVPGNPTDSEARLLDAAEAVFAERGFHAATTVAIAERAGLNKTLIHYYFRSKDGLYQAMLERIASRHSVFLDDLAHQDPVAALTAATRRLVRLLAANRNYVRLCAYGALEGTADRQIGRRLMQAATQAIQRGADAGVFRNEDPRHVLASIEGMIRFFFEHEDSWQELWGDAWDRERVVEERSDHVVRMLLQGLGSPAAKPVRHATTQNVAGGKSAPTGASRA